MKKCPKCRYVFDTFDTQECPRCNYQANQQAQTSEINVSPAPQNSGATALPPSVPRTEDPFAGVDTFMVQQKKEMGEILLGFETKNSYIIRDKSSRQLFTAQEESQSSLAWLVRIFLSSMRPFKVRIANNFGATQFWLDRPFRFMFHKLDILDGKSSLIGTVQKRFSFFRRIYTIYNEAGMEEFALFGPILKPWTFFIHREGEELGSITKKWSGLLKETFSSADNFGATFPENLTSKQKSLLLGAMILIDFVHFERKG